MKKVMALIAVLSFLMALTLTVYAEEIVPPPEGVQEEVISEEIQEEVISEETQEEVISEETQEEVISEETLLKVSGESSPVGPTDTDPVDLGLPDLDEVNQKFYGALCGKTGYPPCEKYEKDVEDGGVFEPTVYPKVVVIKTGGQDDKEYFFIPEGADCKLIEGGDPYCVTFSDGKIIVERNMCIEKNKGGECVASKEISNIQLWGIGSHPTPTPDPEHPTPTPDPEHPTPTPDPTKPTPQPGEEDSLVIKVDVSTGGDFQAVTNLLWIVSASAGISIPFLGKKKK